MVEDCRDVAQEVPFIGTEEKCEELVFDECVEVRIIFGSVRSSRNANGCSFRS